MLQKAHRYSASIMKRANCCIENRSFKNYFTGQLWSTFHTFSHDTGSLSITQRLFSLLLEVGTPILLFWFLEQMVLQYTGLLPSLVSFSRDSVLLCSSRASSARARRRSASLRERGSWLRGATAPCQSRILLHTKKQTLLFI